MNLILARQKALTLISDTSDHTDSITISGREITVHQEPHIRADISAAKAILHKLLDTQQTSSVSAASIYTTEVLKEIEV